jgi:hypothetical protein
MVPTPLAGDLALVVDLNSQLTSAKVDLFHGHHFERELPQTIAESHNGIPFGCMMAASFWTECRVLQVPDAALFWGWDLASRTG